MTEESEYNYDKDEIGVELKTKEDYVYVVTKVLQEQIPHTHVPVGVYEEEEDALEAISEYKEEFEFAHGYKMVLQ